MSVGKKWMPYALALVASLILTWCIQSLIVMQGMESYQERLDERAIHLANIRGKAIAQGAMITAGTSSVFRDTAQGVLSEDNPQILARLAYIRASIGAEEMLVIGADGIVKSYLVPPGIPSIVGKDFSWRPYFSGAMEGKLTVYAALGTNSGKRGFYVSAPILADSIEKPPVGVVVAKLGFEEIDHFLDVMKPLPTALVSPEGIIFAVNIPEWRFKVLGGQEQLEAARNSRRAGISYEKSSPVLLPAESDGRIKWNGSKLQVLSAPIDWSDPSGGWRLVGFVDPVAIFTWPERVATATVLFLFMTLFYVWQRARQRALRRTRQVVNLLDNSGQGFLAFTGDLVVLPDFSRACLAMLGVSPAGREVAGLLFGPASPQAELMRETIASVAATEDPDIRASMLSLLPREVQRGDTILAVEYRLVGPMRFMVILTDMTEERRISARLELEQQHLRMIVAAVSDNRNFFEAVDTFREFLKRHAACPLDGKAVSSQEVRELYRDIHTFKGILGQFCFPKTPQRLHDVESTLAGMMSSGSADLSSASLDVEGIRDAFESDLAVLGGVLGEDFMQRGRTLVLKEEQVRALEALSLRLLRGEAIDTAAAEVRSLLADIIRLRKVRLSDSLMSYDRLVRQVAQRLDKQVKPLAIDGGDDAWIDPEAHKPFLQSLVHVFRNAVIHGLEMPEARWEQDKDEAGTIACTIRSEGARIGLTIADDGAGIDVARLRRKARENGIASVDNLSDEEVADLVFMDSISTQEDVTVLAGRGVGLAAVRSETEKLGGQVTVRSRAGLGCEFRFVLPLSIDGDGA
ncbi:ATP-binding protein [Herbaspirillum sp.]|uniref:ATP-binding protein n=1 Tax=Herbaspirillum sp. TaxID=1890675 RepID=UPI001B1716A8|nr:ATP-binding protein [Herbaspirillum sp.]MBO9537360.1 hypothetical protein [Herbaspirillum sp.]